MCKHFSVCIGRKHRALRYFIVQYYVVQSLAWRGGSWMEIDGSCSLLAGVLITLLKGLMWPSWFFTLSGEGYIILLVMTEKKRNITTHLRGLDSKTLLFAYIRCTATSVRNIWKNVWPVFLYVILIVIKCTWITCYRGDAHICITMHISLM